MTELFYLAKLGELTLKKGNAKEFEQRLIRNLRLKIRNAGARADIRLRAGRMYITAKAEFKEQIENALDKLIGITGWAQANPTEKKLDSIIERAIVEAEKAKKAGCRTFKIESRRADKKFYMDSYAISRAVGGAIHQKGLLKVDVHKPDITIKIEVREKVLVYGFESKGLRGLPSGSASKGLLLLSGGIDSPVAGFKMLSRGMKLNYIYFHSHPYTSPEALKKVEELARILADYGMGGYLNTISFTKVQQKIKETAPEPYLTIMMRICMVKIANMVGKAMKAKSLITGESLAQVASQTVENLAVTNSYAELPVFRPLIGTDKQEIVDISKEIGTYETSILPYEDCCVLFSPEHPIIHSSLKDAREIFKSMKIEALLEEAFFNRQIQRY